MRKMDSCSKISMYSLVVCILLFVNMNMDISGYNSVLLGCTKLILEVMSYVLFFTFVYNEVKLACLKTKVMVGIRKNIGILSFMFLISIIDVIYSLYYSLNIYDDMVTMVLVATSCLICLIYIFICVSYLIILLKSKFKNKH